MATFPESASSPVGPRLCTFCGSIDLDQAFVDPDLTSYSGYQLHPSISAMHKSASDGCSLCAIFVSELPQDFDPASTEAVKEDRIYLALWDYNSHEEYSQGATMIRVGQYRPEHPFYGTIAQLSCYVPDGSSLSQSRIVSGRPVSQYVTATESQKWLRRQLRSCLEKHGKTCPDDDMVSLPTRVIDVGAPDGSEEPRMLVSRNVKAPWVSLSHCWGISTQFVTISANLEQRKRAILFDLLPPTFRDAVTVVRMIGCRYLWIDSLCIIQDSIDDWLAESQKMGHYYQKALFTISVEDSLGDHEGFLHYDRRPDFPKSFQIPVQRNSLEDSQEYIHIRPTLSHHGFCRRETPLASRGWTLQERVLSRRIVHFTRAELVWECNMGMLTESCRTPREPSEQMKICSDLRLQTNSPAPWHDLVGDYVQRSLTKSSDRLIAISALAREFHQRTQWRYLAGLWRENIAVDLTWRMDVDCRPQAEYIAPSWSWASLSARDDSLSGREHDLYRVELPGESSVGVVNLASVEIASASLDPFGAVRYAHIILQGLWLAKYAWDQIGPPHLNASWSLYRSHWYDERETPHKAGIGDQWICQFDSHPPKAANIQPMFQNVSFLRIVKSNWNTYPVFQVLMLVPVDGGEAFRRVGLAEVPDCDSMRKLAWERKEIKII